MNHLGKSPIILLGAGGFAREVLSWLAQSGKWVVALYDEMREGETAIHKVPVINDLKPYKGCEFLGAVGDPKLRLKLWQTALAAGLSPAEPFLHHTVLTGENCYVSAGSIICPYSVLTVDVIIAEACILNLSATAGHGTHIGAFTTVSPGANISGDVKIGPSSYIGTNACIKEKIKIGNGCTVGMGAVVVRDIPDGITVVGNPAREMPVKLVSS